MFSSASNISLSIHAHRHTHAHTYIDISYLNFVYFNIVIFGSAQGPFDTFLVGGDTAEVCDIKFSNDGKSMLLTTTNNNVYLLDAYHGEKVSFVLEP